MKIIESERMVKKVLTKEPKTKKKRIIKKFWSKYSKIVPDTEILVSGDKMICHPVVAAELRRIQREEMRQNNYNRMGIYNNFM